MPNIGDRKRAYEIGIRGHAIHIWSACPVCLKEQWIPIYDAPRKCKECALKREIVPKPNKEPYIGEIRSGRDIGRTSGPSNLYMWTKCIVCEKERWTETRRGKALHIRCKYCKDYLKGKHGADTTGWKCGVHNHSGYIELLILPSDQYFCMANKNGFVLEHRLVVARSLGRCLEKWEVVHHVNGIKTDNRIENLQLVSVSDHTQITFLAKEVLRLTREVAVLKEQIMSLKKGAHNN